MDSNTHSWLTTRCRNGGQKRHFHRAPIEDDILKCMWVPERSCAISLKPLLRRFLSSRGMFEARPLVSVDRPALGFASECCLWICKAAGSRSTIITIIIITVINHHQHHHFLTMQSSYSVDQQLYQVLNISWYCVILVQSGSADSKGVREILHLSFKLDSHRLSSL